MSGREDEEDESGSGPGSSEDEAGASHDSDRGRRRRTTKEKVVYRGQGVMVASGPSGKEYRFPGHGSIVEMESDDAEDLAARVRKTRACCGKGVVERQLFAIV